MSVYFFLNVKLRLRPFSSSKSPFYSSYLTFYNRYKDTIQLQIFILKYVDIHIGEETYGCEITKEEKWILMEIRELLIRFYMVEDQKNSKTTI